VKEVDGDTNAGEEQPMLPKEEREQLAIQKNHAEDSRRPNYKQLKPKYGKQQADTRQPN
jgi:hypothetical protein